MQYASLQEMAEEAMRRGMTLGSLIVEMEAAEGETTKQAVIDKMQRTWEVMKDSVAEGVQHPKKSRGGMIGGDGAKLIHYCDKEPPLSGKIIRAVGRALAVAEFNASMGRIVAAPTAGSSGILPGVLTTVAQELKKSDEEVVVSLFTAAAVGMIISEKASVSGAQGGCQAECGSAAAMAAAAVVELAGGNPEQAVQAVAISLKNNLGLVCDPVAGLVEVPCAKRNALGASNALVAADMALAGIQSVIPADEVIEAMGEIGKMMPHALKETARGGLATTPTGQKILRSFLET